MTSSSGTASSYGFTNEYQNSYIKLIYLRSRMYSTLTGRFLTRDSWQGDYNRPLSLNRWNYVNGNPVNYTDPSGYQAEPQCSAGYRYCVFEGEYEGVFIDYHHWEAAKRIAFALDERIEEAIGYPNKVFSLEDEGFFYGLGYGRKYVANIPTGLHPDTLRDIKLGIFMNLEWHLESFEAAIPNCYSALGKLKRCSAFSNEDLPSDYLGFIANMNSWSIGDVVNALGQDLKSHGSNDMPAKNAGTLWDAFRCNYFGNCGDDNPYNTCWTSFKVPSENGKFAYLPLPDKLIFKPIGPGEYWKEYDN